MKLFFTILSIITLSISLAGCNLGTSNSSNSTTATATVWMIGQTAPDNNVGNVNDLYLNTTSSDIYTKQNGSWAFAGNIRGQVGVKGNQGDKGNQWFTGVLNPDPTQALGSEGDFYINTVSSDIFQKQNNLWVIVFNIKGVKGDKGDTGTAGKNGVVWYTGTVTPPPAAIAANISDFYLNTQTGELFRKDITGWIGPVTIIKGTNGRDGTNGVNGTNGTSGSNGATWISGTGNPVAGAGNVGNLYFEVLTGSVFQKNMSGWGNSISVLKGSTGLTGSAGVNGTNGSVWCSSATVTDPNSQVIAGCANDGAGNQGDFFVNSVSGDVFNKTTASTWVKTFTMAVSSTVTSYIQTQFAALQASIQSSLTPVGTIISYGGATCPSGYLPADGGSYKISDYQSLATAFTAGNNTYIWGAPDSSHFFVPDLRGQFIRGADTVGAHDPNYGNRYNRGGSQSLGVGSIQSDQFQGFGMTVALTSTNAGGRGDTGQMYGGTDGGFGSNVNWNMQNYYNSGYGNPRVGSETRPTNVALLYCVKN